MGTYTIKPGSIGRTIVYDPQTGQRLLDEHFVIVLSSQEDIDAGSDLRVAVCTTSFRYPLQDGWFSLPHAPGEPGGHDRTGFSEATVVKGTWLQRVAQSAIIFRGKRAPMKIVRALNEWLRIQLQRAQKQREQTGRS